VANNSFTVTVPGYLLPKFNKVMESLNLGRQETVLHLISEHNPSTFTLNEPVALVQKGGGQLDWNATEPYMFGQSNFGFRCAIHGVKHEAGTEMIYAGPEDNQGNRRKLCPQAADELNLSY
jgi:hypothetical protein